MDAISLIGSINKIAMIAFVVTFGFITYEIYLLVRERKKNQKPSIPRFKEGKHYSKTKVVSDQVHGESKVAYKKPSKRPIVVLLFIFILLGVVILAGLSYKYKLSRPTSTAPETIDHQIVASEGIVLYTKDWVEITNQTINNILPGSEIYIGIVSIPEVAIDKARIRVNSDSWGGGHETTQFKGDLNVFYRSYTITTDEAKLNIEAQLHSLDEGWLGE